MAKVASQVKMDYLIKLPGPLDTPLQKDKVRFITNTTLIRISPNTKLYMGGKQKKTIKI